MLRAPFGSLIGLLSHISGRRVRGGNRRRRVGDRAKSLRIENLELRMALAVADSTGTPPDVTIPLYGFVEQSFIDSGNYSNPYTQATASATLTRPDLTTWTVPLFWDGGDTWRIRVSPDQIGTWTWQINSADAGLNDTANDGAFTVVASTNRGGIQPMTGYPYHFQYENGDPFWLLGDMNWHATSTSAVDGLNHDSVANYVNVRAAQGFNFISANVGETNHSYIGGMIRQVNEGGYLWSGGSGPGTQVLNPGYFQAVDDRLAHMNSQGVTLGMILNWDAAWIEMSSAQRLLYAEYVTARYSAHNVIFLVAGEWGENGVLGQSHYNAIGQKIAASDPHDRLIGIHSAPSAEVFADQSWFGFGDYMQEYSGSGDFNGGTPEYSANYLHQRILQARDHNKPVINGEYGFYKLDSDQDGDFLDWGPASNHLEGMRNDSWELVMAGGYFVTSFGNTYSGGIQEPSPNYGPPQAIKFHVADPNNGLNADWEEDVQHIQKLFTDRRWWTLQPSDSLVTGAGTHYALAEIGQQYLAYVRGNSGTNSLSLGGAPSGTYTIRRFNPRTGQYTDIGTHTEAGPITLDPPDSQDYVFVVTPTVSTQEIDVQSGVPLESITDGDSSPNTTDHTDFGSVNATDGSTLTRTFTVRNTGTASLTLTGSPIVTVSGPHASDFVVTVQPAASVAAGGGTTFQVRFDPSDTGLRTASLSFATNDSDENPYNFSIQGTGSSFTLAAEWKFSASSGATAVDSSGNSNTATLSGGPTFVAGQLGFGNVLSLDGVNDYASVANSASVNLTKNFTLSAWIRPDVVNLYQGIVTKVTGTSDKQYILEVSDTGQLSFEYEAAGNNYALGGGTLTAGVWQFVAATIDNSLNVKLYINGVQVASGTAPAEVTATTQPVNIGRYGGTYNASYFDGLLDSVRIHNTALSAAELQILYNRAANPGDYDGNGQVESADWALWRASFGSTSNLSADGNGDDIVDAADYVVWRKSLAYGALVAQGAADVADSSAASIDEAVLAPLKAETTARWATVGTDRHVLSQHQFVMSNPGGNTLRRPDGGTIFVDHNAAGDGRFHDRMRWENPLFRRGTSPDGLDLLTLLAHELGHALSVEQADEGVMEEMLSAGERDAPAVVAQRTRDVYFTSLELQDEL